jgi:hypothetical protein
VGLRDKGFQFVELDVLVLIVAGIVIGGELHEVVPALLQPEPLPRPLVGGEDARGGPQLGDHVADRGPSRDVYVGNPFAVKLEDAPEAAPHAAPPQELEDHILRRHPVRELPRKLDADDLGSGGLEGLSGHHQGHVETPGPDGYGPEGA